MRVPKPLPIDKRTGKVKHRGRCGGGELRVAEHAAANLLTALWLTERRIGGWWLEPSDRSFKVQTDPDGAWPSEEDPMPAGCVRFDSYRQVMTWADPKPAADCSRPKRVTVAMLREVIAEAVAALEYGESHTAYVKLREAP